MPNYSELVDLFLTFLLPEHASEIGKFFEHFVLSNMANLLQKLKIHFKEQPAHIKKIYACLNDLSNEQNLTMDRLKAKVLPLLKSNSLLTDWFMQLFDKPMESLPAEYETVHIKKSLSDTDNSDDNHEEIYTNELIECPNIDDLNACGVKYKNGKLMYQGTLLPAKISFLAHDAPPIISEIKDPETSSLCLHQIRKHIQFNDPKKPEDNIDGSDKQTVKKKGKKFKLCDQQTLHAHAVRLNSVHAQNGEKLSDLMHLLNPSNAASGEGTSDEKSPKKQRNVRKSPKKVLSKSSPTNAAGTSSNNVSSPNQSLSKKAQNSVDDCSEENPRKKVKMSETADPSIPKAANKGSEKRKLQGKSSKVTESTLVSKKSEVEGKSTTETLNDRGGWTRDEDQVILEQFQVGYKDKKELLDVLLKKLNRTRSEIDSRYDFLLDIVKMHQSMKSTQ